MNMSEENIIFGNDYYGEDVNELAISSLGYIKTDIADIKKNYIKLGFHLNEMEKCKYYQDLGYDNFYDCIEKNFHMDKSAVSRVIGVWREFCTYEDGSSTGKMWVDDKYEKFTYSQLVEMLPLKDTERRKVRSDMTVLQIREFKKKLKGERSSTEKKEKEEVATSQQEELPCVRGCITGKSLSGNCVCCGKGGTVSCCADCSEDCNGRCGWIEDKDVQPDFPVMKNMKQREDFVNDYKSWSVWCENKCTEEIFYRYDLPDGYAIVVKCFPYYVEWTKEEREDEEYYLLPPEYHHFSNCKTCMTELKEHLKTLNKK